MVLVADVYIEFNIFLLLLCLSVLATKEFISKQFNDNDSKEKAQHRKTTATTTQKQTNATQKCSELYGKCSNEKYDAITAAEKIQNKQTNVHNSIENQRIKSVLENAKW